jgi:hypothetical protein
LSSPFLCPQPAVLISLCRLKIKDRHFKHRAPVPDIMQMKLFVGGGPIIFVDDTSIIVYSKDLNGLSRTS